MPSKDRKVQLNFSICADLPDETPAGHGRAKGKEATVDTSPESKASNAPIPISSDDSSDRSRSRSLDIYFNDAATRRRLRAWLSHLEMDSQKNHPGDSSRDAQMGVGSSHPRRRSLSSERCENSGSTRLLAAQEELRLLKGLYDQAQAEIRQLKAEVATAKEGYERVVEEARNLQRRERSTDGIRAAALEEGYRRGIHAYRERITLLFPNIDRNRLP